MDLKQAKNPNASNVVGGNRIYTLESKSTVIAVFGAPDEAHKAVEALRRAGYPDGDMQVIVKQVKTDEEAVSRPHLAKRGALTGLVAGAAIVGIVSLISGNVGLLPVPDPLWGLLGGVVAGGVAGTVVGYVRGRSKQQKLETEMAAAREKEAVERQGASLLVHPAAASVDQVSSLLRQAGALSVSHHS